MVKLWAIQPGPMDKSELVERAARICYRSEMASTVERCTEFLTKLAKRGHLSVFEHARYVFAYFDTNPYKHYWSIRYGTNITGPRTCADLPYFVVSLNARNSIDLRDYNPVTGGEPNENLMSYDELTSAERLAHASATFEIGGISRACSHQLVRHRVMSFSQESQRYCDSGEWVAVTPPSIYFDCQAYGVFVRAMQRLKRVYSEMRRFGIPKQDARFVLPNATPTRLMVTATFEHWRHFLSLRLDKAAQWEIRGVAQQIHTALMEVEPILFKDLVK